jgi:FKBP-type peptidyl-prolyl cis-trans isomerase FkpA
MKKTSIILGGLVMLLVAACNSQGFKKTKSGLMYKIISNGKGAPAKKGDIIKIHFVQKVRDSLLGSSYGQMPFYSPVDSIGPMYDPKEIFPLLRNGDSAVVILMADTLLKKQGQLPPFIKRTDKITLSFRVAGLFTSDSAAQADQMAEMSKVQQQQQVEAEKQKVTKVKELEAYLAKNKIVTQKTASGTYVEIKDPGTGMLADSGKKAYVRYAGRLFSNGKEFETNMGPGKEGPGKEGYPVTVGPQANVINGWNQGLRFLKGGAKATLYIPFFDGYGQQSNIPGSQPYETLVFDIQIDSVVNVAPPPAAVPPPPTAPVPAPKK